jgi:hypothetical protein
VFVAVFLVVVAFVVAGFADAYAVVMEFSFTLVDGLNGLIVLTLSSGLIHLFVG